MIRHSQINKIRKWIREAQQKPGRRGRGLPLGVSPALPVLSAPRAKAVRPEVEPFPPLTVSWALAEGIIFHGHFLDLFEREIEGRKISQCLARLRARAGPAEAATLALGHSGCERLSMWKPLAAALTILQRGSTADFCRPAWNHLQLLACFQDENKGVSAEVKLGNPLYEMFSFPWFRFPWHIVYKLLTRQLGGLLATGSCGCLLQIILLAPAFLPPWQSWEPNPCPVHVMCGISLDTTSL